MKNGLKLVLVTLPIILIGVAFVAYVMANRPAPERQELAERATPVRAIVAQHRSVVPMVTAYGIVQPARTYEAIVQVGGIAEYVNPTMKKGAILPADSVLLQVSQADYTLAIAQARANIRAAEAKLAELAITQENLSAALAIENEALDLKANDLERAQRLFAGGTVSQAALDAARTTHLAQRQKVQSVKSSLSLLPTQRAVQTEQIALSQANLDIAALNLARTKLTLPFTARVANVAVEVGQFARAGQMIAQFDGVNAAEIEAQVSVTDLRKLLQSTPSLSQNLILDPSAMTNAIRSFGLSATVRLRVGREVLEWPASVDRVSDMIDQKTGMLGMIMRVDTAYSSATPGSRPPLTKGMFVEITLSAPEIEGIVVPRSAFRDGKLMIADAENRLQFVTVSTRFKQGEIAILSKGLETGARIVISAPSPAISGMLLDVTQDETIMNDLAAEGNAE